MNSGNDIDSVAEREAQLQRTTTASNDEPLNQTAKCRASYPLLTL